MYWHLTPIAAPEGASASPVPDARRFILHRHHDQHGPHLDLRLEQEGYLLGWRISATTLDGAASASEKAPHPPHWLDTPGEAVREDSGVYAWHSRDAAGGIVLLWGSSGLRALEAKRMAGLDAQVVEQLFATLSERQLAPEQACALVEDGLVSRQRAVQRFCGLGRELDGPAFDEAMWKKTLALLSLAEIHQHLRAYELRFDQKYPPLPVSQPEPLEANHSLDRENAALSILQS